MSAVTPPREDGDNGSGGTVRRVGEQSRTVTFYEGTIGDELELEGGSAGVGLFGDVVLPKERPGQFKPAVVERAEFDHEGEVSSTTTVCGETENRRESDKKPKIVVEGFVVGEQLPKLRQIQIVDELTMVSDLYQGRVEVKRVTFEQNTDQFEYEPVNGNESYLAFPFQLQLRQP